MNTEMKYLEEHKKDGDICPFCRSRNISYKAGYTDHVLHYSNGECYDCKKLWQDVYHFHNTQERIGRLI